MGQTGVIFAAMKMNLWWWQKVKEWCEERRNRRRLARQAHLRMLSLFDDPASLRGTSLRPAHRRRVDLVDFEEESGELKTISFTILRHPRPYPFSRQFHEVMQLYVYDVERGNLRHEKSLNLTRLRGRDGEGDVR